MPAVVPHSCSGPASQKAVEVPLLQFFDKDSDMPVVVQQQALVSTCRQLWSYRSCSSACSPWRFQGAVHGHGRVHAHSLWRRHRRTSLVFGALYTGTGPRAPVMRTGAGWRRRPGEVSRGGWHPLISCIRRCHMDKHMSSAQCPHHHHHTPHHTLHTTHTHPGCSVEIWHKKKTSTN